MGKKEKLMPPKSLQNWAFEIEACVPDTVGLVLDHYSEANIAIK